MASQKPRLVAEISEDTDQRLRHLVVLRRQSLARVLDDVLNAALPSRAELAAQVGQAGGSADDQR